MGRGQAGGQRRGSLRGAHTPGHASWEPPLGRAPRLAGPSVTAGGQPSTAATQGLRGGPHCGSRARCLPGTRNGGAAPRPGKERGEPSPQRPVTGRRAPPRLPSLRPQLLKPGRRRASVSSARHPGQPRGLGALLAALGPQVRRPTESKPPHPLCPGRTPRPARGCVSPAPPSSGARGSAQDPNQKTATRGPPSRRGAPGGGAYWARPPWAGPLWGRDPFAEGPSREKPLWGRGRGPGTSSLESPGSGASLQVFSCLRPKPGLSPMPCDLSCIDLSCNPRVLLSVQSAWPPAGDRGPCAWLHGVIPTQSTQRAQGTTSASAACPAWLWLREGPQRMGRPCLLPACAHTHLRAHLLTPLAYHTLHPTRPHVSPQLHSAGGGLHSRPKSSHRKMVFQTPDNKPNLGLCFSSS